MIACAHPGKIGDALWSLPTVRHLARRHGCRADFYTSDVCRPLTRLLEYQSCIRTVVIPDSYRMAHDGCGVQPWFVPVPSEYEAVYQLGFRSYPDRPLPEWIAHSVGAPWPLPVFYEHPPPTGEMDVILAPRGDSPWRGLFEDFVEHCPCPLAQVGAAGEAVGSFGRDLTGLDFLETTGWLAGAKAFVGLHSALLVLAAGFPCRKVVVGAGDLRHALHSDRHAYLRCPRLDDLLREVNHACGVR